MLTETQRLWNLGIGILPIFVLMAFKSPDVGSDTENYIHMYESIEDSVWYYNVYGEIEPGYNVFQKILHAISANPQTLMVAVALITAIALFYFFRESKHCCLALYFFTTMGFLTFALSGLRQTLAIDIGLFAYRFIKDRKGVLFFLMVILAFTFHKSALFMIPAYFIANQKLKAHDVSFLSILLLIVFFFADRFLLTIADVMSYNYGIEYTGNGYQFFAIILVVTILAVRNRENILRVNHDNAYVMNINFLSLAMWTIRLVSRTAERVSLYFLPYTAILISEHLATFPKPTRRMYTAMCVLIATLLLIHRISAQQELSNYLFFFMY